MECVANGGRWVELLFQVFFLSFFSPVSTGEEWKRTTPCCQTTPAPRDGGWSFDGTLETPTWESILKVLLEWF